MKATDKVRNKKGANNNEEKKQQLGIRRVVSTNRRVETARLEAPLIKKVPRNIGARTRTGKRINHLKQTLNLTNPFIKSILNR